MQPNVLSDNGQRIRKGGLGLDIPGGLTDRQLTPTHMLVSQDGYQGEEPQQSGCGAQDRQVRPLALRLDAEMGAHFVEGNFQLPSQHEPLHDLQGVDVQISAQQRLGLELALRVADQDPADRNDGLTTVPETISIVRRPSPYHCGTVTRCQRVLRFLATCAKVGKR